MTLDVLYLAWNRLDFTRATFGCLLENTDWGLVRRLVVYDDGSTDGTREYLDDAVGECPVDHAVVHLGFGSPVATMNHYLGETDADAFAKVDNDIAVPPGWLTSLLGVLEASPELELLGMEAGQTRLAEHDADWDGSYAWRPCSHIGGVGVMRVSAFRGRQPMTARGRLGFTEWQHAQDPVRGWIEPDLLAPQLDRMPLEPWRSLADAYAARDWQRRWPPMDDEWARPYYAWLLERLRDVRDPDTDEEWQAAADAAHALLLLDSARRYGLVAGGPAVVVDRCVDLLERAAARGVAPQGSAS